MGYSVWSLSAHDSIEEDRTITEHLFINSLNLEKSPENTAEPNKNED